MAYETKAPQIENPEKITAKDLAEMVKQIRHNQRRCQRNPTPEKFDGVGKCVILGRLLQKIKKNPKIKDKNFGSTKIMLIFAA